MGDRVRRHPRGPRRGRGDGRRGGRRARRCGWLAASTSLRPASIGTPPSACGAGSTCIGGFRGDETAPEQRDWTTNETVLSGAVGARREEGSLHVVTGADDAVLDGFTICDGFNLPGGPPPHHMSPETLARRAGCKAWAPASSASAARPRSGTASIRDNVAAKGAGMYNLATREWPTDETRPAPAVVDCTFLRNHARARGGAVCNDLMTHATFVDCSFLDNRCDAKGGAMYNDFDCSPTLVSCLFAGNVAHKGGGVANDGRSSPVLTNCTFTRNHATAMYGALYSGTGPTNVPNAPVVTNCIFWSDTADAGPARDRRLARLPDRGDVLLRGGRSRRRGQRRRRSPLRRSGSRGLPAGAGVAVRGQRARRRGAADGPRRQRALRRRGLPDGAVRPRAVLPAGCAPARAVHGCGFQAPVDMGAYERQEPSVDPDAPRVVFVSAANREGPWDGRSWATAFTDLQEALARGLPRRRGGLGGRGRVPYRRGRRPPPLVPSAGRSCALRRLRRHGGAPRAARLEDATRRRSAATSAARSVRPATPSTSSWARTAPSWTDSPSPTAAPTARASTATAPACSATTPCRRPSGTAASRASARTTAAPCTPTTSPRRRSRPATSSAATPRAGARSSPASARARGFTGCRFVGNSARWRAGAVQIDYGSGPSFTSCVFESCASGGHGGALFLESVAAQIGVIGTTIEKCPFVGNSAALRGGAVGAADASEPLIAGCTFTANRAGAGGGAISADERVTVTLRPAPSTTTTAGRALRTSTPTSARWWSASASRPAPPRLRPDGRGRRRRSRASAGVGVAASKPNARGAGSRDPAPRVCP